MADSNLKNEVDIYRFWMNQKLFQSDLKSKKRHYSLLVPPPNLTGELHLGHAMQHAILDAISRYRRMRGFDVLLLPGIDHAGIQFEATFDKKLARENLSKQKLGREKWLELAWKFKDEIYKSVSQSWRMMGLSADWQREVFTLDDGPRKAVLELFRALWNDGLIYKGPYIVQWCPKCNTAIEDVEMEYEERKEKLYYVRYLIEKSNNEYITVATTRPETIWADTAIAVYLKHPTYRKYVGKKAHIPLPNAHSTLIPIVEDKRVEKDFGTGALKVTPGHDLLDYEIGKDHSLDISQAVDKNGRMTRVSGDREAPAWVADNGTLHQGLEGLSVKAGREASVSWLDDNGAIEKVEDYTHSVAVCERCKTVVEPLISEEWFVKMDSLAKGAISAIKQDKQSFSTNKIKFLPRNYNKILVDWLENIHDWCISRSLWWGHRIPVWYRKESQKSKVKSQKFEKREIRISLESPGEGWEQEEKVLDTWFSSGLWPLSTLGWPEENSKVKSQKSKLLERYFPWDFEISAPEIKYLWIARMIMISVYLTGDIPFKTMFFHGMLRDLQGRKFSKSLGNGIDPAYLINNWGVDATRMALYTYAIPGRDGRVSKQLLDERGKNFRNFATKIRNIGRFIYELNPQKDAERRREHADDKWICEEFAKTLKKVSADLEEIKLHLAVDVIYEFVWHKFADVYIEKSKKRRGESQATLEFIFKNILTILHPFMPFLTEELYLKYIADEESVIAESWPK